ncbi:MAG: leucine-rich repeat protein [Bacteroidaceae bacterium]
MVHIPSHLTALNSSTFEYCTNLITIPPSVTTIDNAVFRGCTRLKIAKMPSGILHMGTDVFKDCAYKPDK